MSDHVIKFLVKASECHFGVNFPEEYWEKSLTGIDDVNNFINAQEHVALYSFLIDAGKCLKFTVNTPDSTGKFIVFIKIKAISGDNLADSIQITSLCGSPTLALYNSLNHVFHPLLTQKTTPNIKRHLANLQADLRTSILTDSSKQTDLTNSLIVVETLQHELDYWDKIGSTAKNRLTRNSAYSFRDILRSTVKDFSVVEALPLPEVEDALENAHNVLDDLWRHEPPFPKERMTHLMDLVGHDILKVVAKQLKEHDIWTENYSSVTELLNECQNLVERWLKSCHELTNIFWPNYSGNMWKEAPYQPLDLIQLNERLSDILSVQTIAKQLIRLLTPQEQTNLQTDDIFKPFKKIELLEFGQYSNNLWLQAQKEFEFLLQPAENRVAAKLKTQLSSINANTRQLLHEFTRYSELINRPVVKQTLLSERKFLLTSLYDYVRRLQAGVGDQHTGVRFETPQIVQDVIATRQMESKAMEVQKTAQKLLNDLQGYENLEQVVNELIKDMKQQNTELFESWTSEVSGLIKQGILNLKETDPVVQFSENNQLMKVNYSERLVVLISEVRQFRALGYHIPSNIEQTSETGKRFIRLARTLEQIANFHNTIGDRMIVCQRPMMLSSALELSKLVQEEKVVSWGDTKSVEGYVETLKRSVEKLSKENNLLASYYHQIADKIKDLENVDLIKEYSRWKDYARKIRDLLVQVEDKGFKNMQNWRLDIETNLCQVLEKQYIKSLDTIHLYLPEIYTDIVYRKSELQFSPDLDTLKEKYQLQLKKFIDIPKNFRGVDESPEIYAKIIENNDKNLGKVTKHTEGLFEQLQAALNHWKSWLQLDPLDVSTLKTWQHWDLNFRASKTFGQEIAKLPSTEERIGCFLIGLSRLRSDFESHNRSFWDQLVSSLKDSIAEDVVKLQNYVDPSTAALTRQAVTVEEVGESGVAHANILRQADEMEECFNGMVQKAKILASWSREHVDSVNRLKGAWERLQGLLENHQHIIAKQMETIKATLRIDGENLDKEIERFAAKWDQGKLKLNTGQVAELSVQELHKQFEGIQEKITLWDEIKEKEKKLVADYEKFNIGKPEIAKMDEVEADIEKEKACWDAFEEFYKEFEAILKEEWIVFRKKIYLLEDFFTDWRIKIKKSTTNPEIVTKILQESQIYEEIIPSLKFLRGEDFTDKHWLEVYGVLQIPYKPIDQLLVEDFLNSHEKVLSNAKVLQQISKKAASEIIVRQALAELDQWEIESRFILIPHTTSKSLNISLIKDFKDILSKIGDNQSLLQSVKNSADYESFSERAALWENKLATLDQNLTLLAQIQRKWVYLEPIFGSGTLIQEKSRFDKIDKDFNHVLIYIDKDPRVSSLCRYPNLSTILKSLQEQLGRCQKSLDNFLAEKRAKFSRFLFLGDDDLLEVVGQSSKEQVIQTHLKKLFAGIHSIELTSDGNKIKAMVSMQGEIVTLITSVNIKCLVEDWLNLLVKEMQVTIKELLVQCLGEGQSPDPLKYPSQVLSLADNIIFTQKTEQAINSMTLPPLLAHYKAQLTHLSSLELKLGEEISSVEQDDVLELKLKSLLLDTIHHIQVIEDLLDANITKMNDWVWKKQLRFYSNSMGEITIKMANARMDYAYEYLGIAQKLVRTPLTDRCFLTLTQGMHLGMGGNPYGPAGTGKTESVKALGQLLGRQVLVFNCDEGIDAASMGRILSGLVQSGAWGCFDEFNRLDEATLSAVSMQIQPLQNALRTQQQKLIFLEQEIQVNRHCGIFVTLNPAGGGYGGRNKLPDNLKQLFRPVVMTHPNHEQIARTLLLCDGYQNGELIGKKLIELFEVSEKVLSHKQHYDWGLRSIRTILLGCGRALKFHRKNTDEAEGNQVLTELTLVVKVLRMNTLSKLTFSDSRKFEGLIKDIFRDVPFEASGANDLVKALEESCLDLKLAINKSQINKCVELYEQLKQRMGVAIVGPPSSGKTTLRTLLFHALSKMGNSLKQYAFNPKSMQKSELLGQIDLDTRQWSDGVLTLYSLEVTTAPHEQWSWIVCDGNIDPEWVEALNSVLDDNKLLTLPSGWRIQFGSNVSFIFETHNLDYASPATISRMGIVFLSEIDWQVSEYIANYLKHQTEEFQTLLSSYISDYFVKCINWVFDEGELVLESSKIAVAKSALLQFRGVKSKNQFIVALINGLGQQLQFDFREVFAQQVFDWFGEVPPSVVLKINFNKDRDIIESYYTNPALKLDFARSKIPLVMTGDVERVLDRLKLWLEAGNEANFLLVGPHGAGKSLILEQLVKERSDLELATIHCSGSLTPGYIINKIAQSCIVVNTNKGKMYKPKRGNLVLYLKNLHLLKPDAWGTNILVEFLHQMITYKAFFDASLELVRFENITIIGSLLPTQTLSMRFTSIINIYNIDLPDPEDLAIITVAYLSSLIKESFGDWPKNKVVKLASTLIAIYDKVRSSFTLSQFKHYEFSPHDLTNWCASLLRYKDILQEDDEASIFEVLAYEGVKRLGDKLVHEEDRKKLVQLINDDFKCCHSSPVYKSKVFYAPMAKNGSLIKFNDEEWGEIVKKGIVQYGREGEDLDVLLNTELLELTSGTARVLAAPEGHVVLVGRSGVGRKGALKIVSALQSAKLISLSFNNNAQQFNIEMKHAMQLAGIEDEQVYFLVEDQILERKNFLSLLNILIRAGEVPGLYNPVELESLVSGLKDEANRENLDGNLLDFFKKRIRRNLHVAVCIDVDNVAIWSVFEQCPALLQKSHIIWKDQWSLQTIQTIPVEIIQAARDVDQTGNFPKILEAIQTETPSRYISMIRLYTKLYANKKNTIASKQTKLKAGVSKLNEAADSVTKLKQKAAEQQEKLAEKQAKANQALDMISNTMKNANSHKEEMQVLKSKTEQENQFLIERKKKIEIELAQVEPLIQEARSAVGNIRQEALSEIRSLRAPPEVIRDILEGVLRLMGIQDTSWNSMKTFLAKRGVKEEIRSFDASRITTENRQAVERLINNKKDSFDAKSAKRASVAAAPLAAWVAANVKYSHVVEKIRPLEREQNKLQVNLTSAENQLGELSAGLLDVDATVAQLKQQLSAYTKEAAEIEIDLNKAQEILAAAEGLVTKLDDEYKRWQQQFEELTNELKQLPDFCSLASAFITYLADETEDGRKKILNLWCKNLGVEHFNIEEFLISEREQLQWQSEGLSCDKQSVQNAIIILQTKITPLVIDPTSSAIAWYKKHCKKKQVEVITQNSPKFQTNLELAVRFGKLLIIEDIEQVHGVLFPLLRHEFVYQGERKLVSLNGKLIDYHNDFALILSSRNEHLKVSADVAGIVSAMNFTVTHFGLCEQLMTAAIRQENPKLEERRSELMRSKEELQEKQYDLQNQLLEDLVNSSGNILQNSNLLASLNETKASSTAISQALAESIQVQAKLDKEYEIYKNISLFGSSLFFACNEFTRFNVLYVISVPAYVQIFLTSLQTLQGLDNSTESQKKHVFQTVYSYIIRGIFKNDRLMFALNLTQKLFGIPLNEWSLFVGNVIPGRGDPDALPPWIPKQSMHSVLNLQLSCPDLYQTLQLQEQTLWNRFMYSNNCEKELPSHCKISEFQKAIVVQALRPDRCYSAMTQCVLYLTGLRSIDSPVYDLNQIYKESPLGEAILILTASGSDPSKEIRNIANSIEVVEVAMGEGQQTEALKTLNKAAIAGQWYILKNLHLVPQWLSVLVQNIQSLEPTQNFKLWLITEPNPKFNFVLAQNCLKIVYEAPQGLRSNLSRNLNTFGSKLFDKLSGTSSRIFFALCCLHGVLQERRRYIPQGWSKWYEFSDTDLATAVKLVEDLWNVSSSPVQWSFISGLCCDAVYGGRIENEEDLGILQTYLRQFLVDEVLSHRWTLLGTKTTLPSTPRFGEYLQAIKQLPERDSPAFFGLPENIDRAWEKQTSCAITDNLKNMFLVKKVTGNGGFSRELWQKNLAPFMLLWRKLNQGLDFVRMSLPEIDGDSPIENFITEELQNAVFLVQKIHKSFMSLNKICKGNTVPDDSDLKTGNSLISCTVPNGWRETWEGPSDPNRYLRSLVSKTASISKWSGQSFEKIAKDALNLSILLRPEAFLACHKQEVARKTKVPMDQLELESTWKAPNLPNYVVLSDLLVEGGFFAGSTLKMCLPSSESINPVPNCYLAWREKKLVVKDERSLAVTLYQNSQRGKEVTRLKIPCDSKEKDKWIQAGLAFYLEY